MTALGGALKSLAAAALLLLAAAAPLQAQPPRPDQDAPAERHAPASATLVVWNRPIVVFRATVRQVSPADRAANAARRIEALPNDVRPESIKVEPVTLGDLRGVLIAADTRGLFGLVDADLDPTTGETLAGGERASGRADPVRAPGPRRSAPPARPLRGVGLSLAATALLALILWATRRAADRARARLAAATHHRAVSLLGRDLWPFLDGLERAMVRVTALAVALVAVYLWLTFVLHQFPYTRPWGDQLGAYLTGLLARAGTGALRRSLACSRGRDLPGHPDRGPGCGRLVPRRRDRAP